MKSFIVVAALACLAVVCADPIVAGGKHKIASDDKLVLESLATMEVDLNSQLNSPYVNRVGKVLEAYSQVVAGIKLYVTFELNETSCLKNETKDYSTCQPKEEAKKQQCYAELWLQPWLHKQQVTAFHC